MIDADLVWRALRTPVRIAHLGASALLVLLLALPQGQAQAQPQAQTRNAGITARTPMDLPWMKARAVARPAGGAIRKVQPLVAVSTLPVVALLPVPILDYKRGRGRAPVTTQQVASTLRAPLPNVKVSSPFGSRVHPTRKRRGFHYGVDYSARRGTPILAAQAGEVTLLGRRRDFGNHLRIDHGHGVETLYGHLQSFVPSLKQGARVKRGEVIGYVGATGRATGPHLHFEVLAQGRQVDPMKLALAVPPEKLLSIK